MGTGENWEKCTDLDLYRMEDKENRRYDSLEVRKIRICMYKATLI